MRHAAMALVLALLATQASAQSLDQARGLAAARDYSSAAHLLEQRLAAAPGDDEARFLLARVRAWNGEHAQALALYGPLLEAEPDNADYLLGQGLALLWAGRAREAVVTLERAARIAPDDPEVRTALAQAAAATAGEGQFVAPRDDSDAAAREVPVSRDRRSLALSARYDHLDRGFDPWRSVRLDARRLPADRSGFYGAALSEHRFGLRDAGVELGAVLPMGAGWSFQPEVGVVAAADFLPAHHIDLRLQRVFGDGWVGAASWRRSAYRDVDVQRLSVGAERYAGPWRMAYTIGLTRLAGQTSAGHDLRLARAYADGSEIGLQIGGGREAALLGPVVVASEVRATTLFGRHAFGDWALLWNFGRTRQGNFYTREGIGIGLERRF